MKFAVRLTSTTAMSALLLLLLLFATSSSACLEDLIDELPGYGRPPTPQFSGFLDASEGCNVKVNGPECKLHYWFALAEKEPSKSPVVLWLNGGPGSSSIVGFLQEQGPLLINATGGLMENPWSWTKYVNLLALEAPIGVGYSYCTRQIKDKEPCQNTDRFTASASRAALVDFFTNKFPELTKNPFYITGESVSLTCSHRTPSSTFLYSYLTPLLLVCGCIHSHIDQGSVGYFQFESQRNCRGRSVRVL